MKKIKQIEATINLALSKLDERGTNEIVTQAIIIVQEAFDRCRNNASLCPDEIYNVAIMQYTENNS